jgi:acyl dehydratase
MPFLRPISDRYFEDYVEGDVHHFGTIAVGADEIVAFANQFDPQTLHTDPEAAKSGPFGGLIASGWHTAGLMTRLFMDHYLTKVASLGSPGGDELRWVKPVRPGDTLSVRVTVLKAVPSKSKPDRGAVTSFVEVINQAGGIVGSWGAMKHEASRACNHSRLSNVNLHYRLREFAFQPAHEHILLPRRTPCGPENRV